MTTLTIYIDFKSAGSYLALDPALELARRNGLNVEWWAFSTAERDTPDSGADQAVIDSHQQVRAASRRAIDTKYAKLRGLDLSYPDTAHSADLALGVLSELVGDRLPFIRAAFAAYWEDHADLDDEGVVAGILERTGAQHPAGFDEARQALAAAQASAEEAGIVDAPAFVIEGQLFIGRQHFPWIEEIARPQK